MEIRYCYIYISCCVLITSGLEAKSISLNDIIAAEENAASDSATRSAVYSGLPGTSIPTQTKKTSSLKYRHSFQIESPLKPKKNKALQKPRFTRKYLTRKREINYNDGIIQKYIPLLKNIRLLVDDILASDSSETYDEVRDKKFKRNSFTTNERGNVVCHCERRSKTRSTDYPQEESIATAVLATAVQDEVITTSVAATTPAFTAFNDNERRIGRNKNIPVLSTRNSTSIWGNDSGFGSGSSSSFNRSFEGYITWDNRDNERNTGEETGPHTENYEEYTDRYTRNDAGRDRSIERLRGIGIESRITELNGGTSEVEKSTISRNETVENVTRNLSEYEREIKYEIRRDETESSISLPELAPGLRGFDSEEKDTTIRTTKFNKESVTETNASDSRILSRNGPLTSENQEISAANQGIAPKHILPNSTYPIGKVVMIFDGYSVAKDVNGKNEFTEKAIQIHT